MNNKLLLFITSFALLLGCAKQETLQIDADGSSQIPINISSELTKLTDDGFVDGDKLGLFAVNYTDNNTTPGELKPEGNQADNVKYVYDGTKWTPVKSVYYKDVNTHVDLYMYYPHQETISDIDESTFEVQKDQSSEKTSTTFSGYELSDFLWGKGTDITPSQSAVKVNLSHKLSAVHLTLIEGTGFGSGEFESLERSVILTNTTRKATLDFNTGEATPVGDPQLDGIVMCPQSDASFRAIVIPQSVPAATRLFSITLDGVSYGFKQNSETVYQAGKQLDVNITINKKTPSGEYELELASSQITDWTNDQNVYGAEARQYYVVNLSTPGTLESTIEAAGKDPAKIKNLKIIGNITTEDFYFMRDDMTILEAVNLKEAKIKNAKIKINYSETLDDAIPVCAFQYKKSLCYFVFPEKVTRICAYAFQETYLSGPLIIPNDVEVIGEHAFQGTLITTVSFPEDVNTIGFEAFRDCKSSSGDLILPNGLTNLGNYAFYHCSFSGKLQLPNKLESIPSDCFNDNSFVGDLLIPESVKSIGSCAFQSCGFTGRLILNNVSELEDVCFGYCGFQGELVIPEKVINIPQSCFAYNKFSSVVFPSTLKSIEQRAFDHNVRLTEIVSFPEGLISIGNSAFEYCGTIQGLVLPSTLQNVGENAFSCCYGISSIICSAIEPPTVHTGAFDGVAKANFTVEVPGQSVVRYQTESGWADFTRIGAHYDFSVSKRLMRSLNASRSKTYTLRAPSNYAWSVESKPDWVTVTPSSGTGKTDITVTVSDMARTDEQFEVNEGSFTYPDYHYYKGRSGQIVFVLDGKDYTFSMDVEQYDCDYVDGQAITYNTKSVGSGIDVVFIGDGYDAKDIAKGTFLSDAEAGYGHMFDIEPYKTYKDYFNVYAVVSMSDDSGIGTENTIVETKFGSYISVQSGIIKPQPESCFSWAMRANPSMDLTKSLTIMLMNTSAYEGLCMMYGDGSAIACCPISQDAYPYNFRGVIQHEAGGHGFGKLGDEYIYHNAFISQCDCGCCEHPSSDEDLTSYGQFKSLGWYKNLSMQTDNKKVPWAHLIYHQNYSDYVDMYEGGYMHSRGMYRSEANSCMNNNIPYYSAISRQAIVERIMYCAGEEFDLESFYSKDNKNVATKGGLFDPTFGVDPNFNRGTGQAPIYMGEHPNL